MKRVWFLVLEDTEVNRSHSGPISTQLWSWVWRSQRGMFYDWKTR